MGKFYKPNNKSRDMHINKKVSWFRFHDLNETDRLFIEQSWLKSSYSKKITLARYYYDNIDTKFKNLLLKYK